MHRTRAAGRTKALWLSVVASLLVSVPVRAQHVDESYETQRLMQALQRAGLTPAAAPEGKTIAYVKYERRRVFQPNDLLVPIILPRFASTWPNAFHWLTERATIARELLLHVGEPYREDLAQESMRNLRDLGIFALVRIVAVKTDDPRRVGLVVYTRDLWSLRFEQSFGGVGKTFSAGAQLVETNLFGRGKQVAARAYLDPLRYSVGETYLDPRVFGRELRAYESFDLIFNRASGHAEGSTGSLVIGRPFYNLAQRTAFQLYAYYADFVARDTQNGEVVGYDLDPARLGAACAPGSPSCVGEVWRDQQLQLQATGDYRVGQRYKQTYTLGFDVEARHVAADAETALAPDQRAQFDALVLPKVRRDVYPFVRYRLELPDYVSFVNLASFGQTETVQRGPRLDGLLGLPLRAYGASSDGLVAHALIGYVWAQSDALVDIGAEGYTRLEAGRVVDQRGILQLRAATPSFDALFGRFVMRANWDVRNHDTQHTLVALGGDNGLRGYIAQQFYAFGARRVICNFEYRTRPWVLASVHLGLVAFYDLGSVYRRLDASQWYQSVGTGLRVLFPQLNRSVFRADFGVPLTRSGFAVQLTYASAQLVPLTPYEDQQLQAQQNLAP